MPSKVDFKKTFTSYRAPKGTFETIEMPERQYIMIDGQGDPNTAAYGEAVQSLYPVAYTLKFASKQDLGCDYVVPPLEGLWWADNMNAFTTSRDESRWEWTLMIFTPEWITTEIFSAAVARSASKAASKASSTRVNDVRLESLTEGTCVQTLHIGAYDDEAAVLARMHDEYIPHHGLTMTGKHHEIYLNDPRRTPPEKLRTILRQPVQS